VARNQCCTPVKWQTPLADMKTNLIIIGILILLSLAYRYGKGERGKWWDKKAIPVLVLVWVILFVWLLMRLVYPEVNNMDLDSRGL